MKVSNVAGTECGVSSLHLPTLVLQSMKVRNVAGAKGGVGSLHFLPLRLRIAFFETEVRNVDEGTVGRFLLLSAISWVS
jgi:hypothetical protein